MSGKIKTTTAFNAIHSNRRRAANELAMSHKFAVHCLKNNGELYAQPHMTYPTQDEAKAECERMMSLNPTRTFVVVSV